MNRTGKVIQNYDIRKPDSPLHNMVGHEDDLMRLQWAPWSETVVYSASSDKTSIVWDLSRVFYFSMFAFIERFFRLDVCFLKTCSTETIINTCINDNSKNQFLFFVRRAMINRMKTRRTDHPSSFSLIEVSS